MKPWQEKEKRDAKDFKAKRQKASGSGWAAPSDSVSADYSIDSKYTSKQSYSITLSTWNKLCEEAAWNGEKIPLLSVKIQDTELVIVSKEDFLQITKKTS